MMAKSLAVFDIMMVSGLSSENFGSSMLFVWIRLISSFGLI